MAHSIWEALEKSSSRLDDEAVSAIRNEAYGTKFDLVYRRAPRKSTIRSRLGAVRRAANEGEGLIPERFIGVVLGARALSFGLVILEEGIDSSGFHFTPTEFLGLMASAQEGEEIAKEARNTFAPLDQLLKFQPITGFNEGLEFAEHIGFGVGVRTAQS